MATQTKPTGHTFYLSDLNHGIIEHPLTIPEEGLLVRLTVQDKRLKASFEQGTYKDPGSHSLQMITWALERLQVD